jgi:tRNA threonylcarbamoyladenosine biosynthesis protein TsaE
MESDSYLSYSEEDTRAIGKSFAEQLSHGDIITLLGDLGAGKTEFVRGICSYFSVNEIVSSPTFTIMNQYFGNSPNGEEFTIYHIDLYRINDPKELEEIGFSECMADSKAIKFVEWPEKADSFMPPIHWQVDVGVDEEHEQQRTITMMFKGEVQA